MGVQPGVAAQADAGGEVGRVAAAGVGDVAAVYGCEGDYGLVGAVCAIPAQAEFA